ncbi:hypothetical protein EVAR_24711_1 [Eumeta japonica]|uniref:Reverse transcriptase domain-containing protein n=1 Tax=Eumeta variegata TaxID=151549 RepID=A0A4C1VDP1_EUMVA|nr:hypothetical protein EVAR_24711_1 [Eumeta japonica]
MLNKITKGDPNESQHKKELEPEIIPSEVEEAMYSLKMEKAPGPDKVTNGLLKGTLEELLPILTSIERNGVRQGDSLLPKLFSAVLENIFRKLYWDNFGLNVQGVKLNHLRFTDDIVLFEENPTHLKRMIESPDESTKQSVVTPIGQLLAKWVAVADNFAFHLELRAFEDIFQVLWNICYFSEVHSVVLPVNKYQDRSPFTRARALDTRSPFREGAELVKNIRARAAILKAIRAGGFRTAPILLVTCNDIAWSKNEMIATSLLIVHDHSYCRR